MLIQSFKLSSETRPTHIPAVLHRRNKLIGRLKEQIQAAKAAQEGSRYSVQFNRRIRNKETGEMHEFAAHRKVRENWWVGQGGKVCFEVRYGMQRIEIAKGKSVIEVGERSELIPTIERLIAAVDAGELDQQVSEAVGSFGRPIKKDERKKQ